MRRLALIGLAGLAAAWLAGSRPWTGAPPASARAGPECAAPLLGGTAPTVPERMSRRATYLCYRTYTALTSPLTRTGVWSAEHVTARTAEDAADLERINSFHPEASLPHEDRAELADYAHSGYDRGHLAPNGDQADPADAAETFSLGQMVPQAPRLNRYLWARIESATRRLAKRDGDVYVVTGALFRGETLQILHDRVYVPTDIWKAVYDPRGGVAGVYVSPNDDRQELRTLSIQDFQAETGIDPFPRIEARFRTIRNIPEPDRRRRRRPA